MAHTLKYPELCAPSLLHVHRHIRDHLEALPRLAEASIEMGGIGPADTWETGGALDHLRYWGPGIYSFPFLSVMCCKQLLTEAKFLPYKVNDEEDEPFQIPECVLQNVCHPLALGLERLWLSVVPHLSEILFHIEPKLVSAQLARYSPDNVAGGNWHRDEDSDVSCVVALSELHTGGGTELRPPGIEPSLIVPQLPTGHALLFLGKTTLHRGLPVTQGERNLLVFWSQQK